MTRDDLIDDQTPHQLISEIQEIKAQYKLEVSTARHTWPRSIKERVLALYRLGINCHKISGLTQVPEPTVSYWCKPEASKARDQRRRHKERAVKNEQGKFLPVISRSQPLTVGSPKPLVPGILHPITVSLPGGIKVRGVTLPELIDLLRAVRT